MAVRVRVRISPAEHRGIAAVETVAVANSGFESASLELLLPVRCAERLGLWPPPRGARVEKFESPAASFSMFLVTRAVRVSLASHLRHAVIASAVISERETEVILNDHLVEALRLELIAPGRGLYRIGRRGSLKPSDPPEPW